jgi:hypothetical protein
MEYIEVSVPIQRKRGQFAQPYQRGLVAAGGSELDDVGGLGTFLALGHIEGDALILLEGAEPSILDGGVVNEEIGTAFVGCNEAETLFRVEPLYGALSHSNFLEMSLERIWPDASQAGSLGTRNPPAGGFLVWERGLRYFLENNIGMGKVTQKKN